MEFHSDLAQLPDAIKGLVNRAMELLLPAKYSSAQTADEDTTVA